MKLYKFVFTWMVITIIAITYVHQRIEIIKAGYSLQKNRSYLSYLVDQNSKLVYNLSRLESPKNLLASLNGEEVVFANRRIRQVESYQLAHANLDSNGEKIENFIGKLLGLFTVSAEARDTD